MGLRYVLLVAILATLTCGCDHYRYTFTTVISETGSIERAFDYEYKPYRRKGPVEVTEEAVPVDGNDEGMFDAAADGGGNDLAAEESAPGDDAVESDAAPAVEAPDTARYMSPLFVMPDPERFVEYELRPNGLHGVWRSDGRIASDFRIITPSYTERDAPMEKPEDLPPTAGFLREAFNEGQVTCEDLVLIKVLTYVEHFHDFYTAAELDEYGDKVIDITAGVFLDALRADLTAEYDISRFEKLTTETLVPFAKKWKRLYVEITLPVSFFDHEGPKSWIGRTMYQVCLVPFRLDLMRLGIPVEDPGDVEQLDSALIPWIAGQMHALIVRRDSGEPWALDAVRAYLLPQRDPVSPHDSSVYLESVRRLLARGYGDAGYFAPHLGNIYNSLAFTSDTHTFEVSVEVPWPMILAKPEPERVEPSDHGTEVMWEFTNTEFFPDGVRLSIVCAQPVGEAQRKLFGKTAIETPEQLKRFISLAGELRDDESAALVEALRECVEAGSRADLRNRVYTKLGEQKGPKTTALEELLEFVSSGGALTH